MATFFISYQRSDVDFAKELKKRIELSGRGLLCWIDEYIPLGEEWKKAIDTEIKDALGVILIVSIASLRSQYVSYEWAFALGQGKKVIPVVKELPDPKKKSHPKMHPKLEDINYFNSANVDESKWEKLLDDLRALAVENDVPPLVRNAVSALSQPNEKGQIEAIHQLRDYNHPAAIEELAKAVKLPSRISMQAGIALAQRNIHDERALEGIANAIQSRNDDLIREGLRLLAEMDSDAAVACIHQAIRKIIDKNPSLTVDIDRYIAPVLVMSSPRVPYLILEYIRAPTGSKQLKYIQRLRKFRDDSNLVREISTLATKMKDGDIKRSLIGELQHIKDSSAFDPVSTIFRNALKHRDYELANLCFDTICVLDKPKANQLILGMIQDEAFREERQRVEQYLHFTRP